MLSRFAFFVVAVPLVITGCDGTGDTGASSNVPSPLAIEAAYRFEEGVRQLQENRAAVAAENLKRVVSLEPRHRQAQTHLCRALVQSGDPKGAAAECQRAIALNPEDIELLYTVAGLHKSAGRLGLAKDTLAVAITRAPKDARTHEMMGAVLLQQGHTAAAINSLKSAVQLNPNNGVTHEKLAIALATTGKCKEAKRAQQSARSLGQNNAAISKTIAACGRMVFGTVNGKAFLIDRRAVSGLEYSACVNKGVCPRVPYGKYNRQPDYKNEPAMSINYRAAKTYCRYVNKRLPTAAEYQAVWKSLKWQGCCARGVIPREWTDTPGNSAGRSILARGTGKELETRQGVMKKGYDSNTVRCASDAAIPSL